MESHCGRLEESPLLKRYGIFKFYCIFLRHCHILGKTAEFPGPDKTVMPAKGIISLLTVLTFHAGHQRHPGYPVSGFQGLNSFPGLLHNTGKLVSQHIREEMTRIPVDSRHIRATDSCIFDFDQHLPFFRNRGLDLLEPDVIFCMDHSCFHTPHLSLSFTLYDLYF